VLRFFSHLRHVKGRWAGRALELDPWQVWYLIRPVFGWKHPDGTRIIRTAWWEFPRKNGKSTISSGIGLYLTCADREPGAEVYAAAIDKVQARAVFDPAAAMVRGAPALRRRLVPYRDAIAFRATNSKFEVLSADALQKHGLNVHGVVVDEVHVHKTRDLIDTLESGTGSRDQPLVVFITTADAGEPDTIYNEKRNYAEQVATGVVDDPSFYAVIYAARKGDDPFSERTWEKANPGIDVTVKRDYLRKEAARAQATPAWLNSFLRLHLGIRTKQVSKWVPLLAWDRSAGMVDEAELRGRACYGGLDLASTTDVAALCWAFPFDDGLYRAIWRMWIPSERIADLDQRTAGQASVWVREGWLRTTPGSVIDYSAIRAQIEEDASSFEVREISFDPWQAHQIAQELADDGLEMVEHRQSMQHMSAPTKELERLVLAHKLAHGGNPVARWMFDNVAVKVDENGNVKPDRRHSGDKIDGIVALVMAIGAATRTGGTDEAFAIIVGGDE
jgi:phage terminase large subunit-like protein